MSTCFAQAEQVLQRALTDDEKSRIKGVVQRVITKGMSPDDLDTAVARAVDAHMDQMLTAALAEKRNAYLNKKITTNVMDWLDTNFADDPGKGLEAMLVGVQGVRAGTRNNIASWMASLNDQWRDTLLVDIERLGEGVSALMEKGDLDIDIRRAIKAMDENAPLTGINPKAVQVATVIKAHLEKMRLKANEAGANIAKRDAYAGAQSHDMMKIIRAGQEAWTAHMKANLDLDKTFGFTDPTMVDDALDELYTRFSTGVHAKFENDVSGGLKGPRNIARSMGHARSLVFKSPEAENAYSLEYGKGTLIESLVRQTETIAQNTGLMQRLGPNAEANLESIIAATEKRLQTERNSAAQTRFKQKAGHVKRVVWPTVNGAAQIPGDAIWAQRWSTLRTVLSMAKLGGAVLSAVSDIPIAGSAHRFQGRSMLGGMADQIAGMFKGLNDVDRRELLAAMGVGLDGFNARFANRFAPEDALHGWMVKANNLYYKYNLLTPHTDRQTAAMAQATSAGWATHVASQFNDVPEAWRRIMRTYGIEEAEWDVIRFSDTRALEGEQFITAEDVEDVGDDIIDTYLRSMGRGVTKRNRLDARTEIAGKVRTLFQDQTAQGVVKPGTKARATLLRGQVPGTVSGEFWRSFAQFKMFPVGVMQGPLGREIYGYGPGQRQNQILGVANLMLANAGFGYAAMALKDIAKGREPRQINEDNAWKVIMAAIVQGGGAGIYGDLLFGDMKNRFGGSAISTLAGPTAGLFDDIFDLGHRLRDGDDAASKALGLVINNTPGLNLFYLRAAIDYMAIYQIKEAINPGYLKRMEKRIKKDNDQVFMYPPSQYAR